MALILQKKNVRSRKKRYRPTCRRRNQMPFRAVYISTHCSGDKIEKNEMGGACSAYGGEERCIRGFGGET